MRWCLALAVAACGPESVVQKLELVEAPPAGEIEPIIAGEIATAVVEHRRLLVYVGAPWCQPCVHFHDAAAAGRLDDVLGDVRVLVFDADRDGGALEHAGYVSNLIPLFAIPRIDGRASGKEIEGAIKGEGDVAQIASRLKGLLAD